jgi:uncharacterized protein YodC (DUF2158 family)
MMAVVEYTGDGKVIRRWKGKSSFQWEAFLRRNLVPYEAKPRIGYGQIAGTNPDNIKW